MVERAAGQQPVKPVTPAQVKQNSGRGMSPELETISKDTSNFVLAGKGKNLLGAGKPHEYSKHSTGESKRVSRFASNLIK
jgi:hypothetical protein